MSVLGKLLLKKVRVTLHASESHEIYAVIGVLNEHDDVYLRLNDCVILDTSARYATRKEEIFIPHGSISILEEEKEEKE